MQPELPPDVVEAIQANRKIEAIKLLREQYDVDLKDAKDIVDIYMSGNTQHFPRQGSRTETGIGRVILIVIVIAILYWFYQSSGAG